MPVASIVDSSLILESRTGWIAARYLAPEVSALGVDRFGKVVPQRISIRASSREERAVFLGTSNTFGVFSARTRLADSGGHVWAAGELGSSAAISDTAFEQVLEFEVKTTSSAIASELWNALTEESAFSQVSDMVVRYRSADKLKDPLTVFRCIKSSNRQYCRIDKGTLSAAIASGNLVDVLNDLKRVFSTEDGTCTFERSGLYAAFLIAGARATLKRPYAVVYDSQQHTATIQINTNPVEQAAVGKGKCAHLIRGIVPHFDVEWTTASWSPLCNGLPLAPN